jgi:FdhD protein
MLSCRPVSDDGHTAEVQLVRVDERGAVETADRVAVERGLEVRLDDEPFAVVMRTPGADRDLAAGFLFSEGVIASRRDITAIIDEPIEHRVSVRLTPDAAARAKDSHPDRRRVAMNAACGMCGRTSLDALAVAAPPVESMVTVSREVLSALPAALAGRQLAFSETGGLHAAALATTGGVLLDSAEDVGRHNAVDKIIGRALSDDRLPLSNALLFVSGRTSFEIVQKAWLAGIPIVASVSAPSSLAVELAERAGMTLVGFVRDRRFNIYSKRHRISG